MVRSKDCHHHCNNGRGLVEIAASPQRRGIQMGRRELIAFLSTALFTAEFFALPYQTPKP
jgi:hypothetical protein